MRPLIVALALLCATHARADEAVMICYNCSCVAKARVQLSEEQLGEMRQMSSRSSSIHGFTTMATRHWCFR